MRRNLHYRTSSCSSRERKVEDGAMAHAIIQTGWAIARYTPLHLTGLRLVLSSKREVARSLERSRLFHARLAFPIQRYFPTSDIPTLLHPHIPWRRQKAGISWFCRDNKPLMAVVRQEERTSYPMIAKASEATWQSPTIFRFRVPSWLAYRHTPTADPNGAAHRISPFSIEKSLVRKAAAS